MPLADNDQVEFILTFAGLIDGVQVQELRAAAPDLTQTVMFNGHRRLSVVYGSMTYAALVGLIHVRRNSDCVMSVVVQGIYDRPLWLNAGDQGS